MKLAIRGIGLVTALGCGVDSFRAGLRGDATPRQREVTTLAESGERVAGTYACLPEGLDRFAPKPALRRLDRFTRMALLASYLAVEDAGLELGPPERVGIVFGTGFGPLQTTFEYQDTIIDDGDQGASPTLFANSVSSALASTVSIRLGIQGPCLTLTDFSGVTGEVMRTASIWLADGLVDYVLAGVGDECHAVLEYSLRQMSPIRADVLEPLDYPRCSYVPGEGFVSFLLTRNDDGPSYGALDEPVYLKPTELEQLGKTERSLLILAACGDARLAEAYRRIARSHSPVAVYSPLYGSLPTGMGFDLAAAAIACRDGMLYPSAGEARASRPGVLTASRPLAPGGRITCIECLPDRLNLLTIAGG